MTNDSMWKKVFCPEVTPIMKIEQFMGINVWVKRDDLNHPNIQGNKLRKLKYNFKFILQNNYSTAITFGGAYSNHIVATAQASQLLNISSIGLIRGEELSNKPELWSPALLRVQKLGMKLVFISRSEYHRKEHSEAFKSLTHNNSTDIFTIPEGGSNAMAIQGVKEVIDELHGQIKPPHYIVCACGTGGTLAGLIDGVASKNWTNTQIIGIAVLKGADFLSKEVMRLSKYHACVDWKILLNYHGGGYAKTSLGMSDFASNFVKKKTIPLDKVYTIKSFFATYDLIKTNYFEKGSDVVILHTGGLQGGLAS